MAFQTLAQSFLTPEEQDNITSCVKRMEKQTSGEIVPMIVSESHSYPLASVTGAVFISLPTALFITRLIGSHFWIGPDNMWLFLVCFSTLYTLSYLLVKHTSWLKRMFLSPSRADEEVREAATTAFFTEGLYRTQAENGILLYISVFERRVWILADSGINEKIPTTQWQEIVDLVTTGVKNNNQCEAICTAVTKIGEILTEFFPIGDDDKNELHNLIIR